MVVNAVPITTRNEWDVWRFNLHLNAAKMSNGKE